MVIRSVDLLDSLDCVRCPYWISIIGEILRISQVVRDRLTRNHDTALVPTVQR